MPRSRARLLAGTIPLLIAACGDRTPTAPPGAPERARALPVAAPTLTTDRFHLVAVAAAAEPAATVDAQRTEIESELELELESDFEELTESTQIINARTRVGFTDTGAYAEGSHNFTGHGGRIETTASVTFDGADLGSQTAVEQRSFTFSFKVWKFISAWAPVYTDVHCGLSVKGRSIHEAWWELFQGRSAPSFGNSSTSSFGGPESQAPCGTRYSTRDGSGSEDSGGMVCTYLVTYDLDTLEVLRVELLYCSTSHGALL